MITVFTPVYNRAYIIDQLYQSLLNQTSYDFEWLIIDDGSEDNIEEVVLSWCKKKENKFDIRFYRQKNGGKHRAINRGVRLAEGDAFFIVDSDDYLDENAIERVGKWWIEIEKDVSFAGVSGLKGNKDRKAVGGNPSFKTYIDATNMERAGYNLLGDKAEVYKTAILRNYPFPEFEGENFITESVVWDRIANDGYRIRWFNEIIYICEYREDGLTKKGSNIFKSSPRGWGVYIQQNCKFYCFSFKERMSQYLIYYLELKGILADQDIQKNLCIDEAVFEEIYKYYKRCIENTIKYIGRKIAVYGLGTRGRKVLRLYQQSDVEVCYILDRKKAELPYRQLELDSVYPEVDAIIITPRDSQAEILEFLEKKTSDKLIGFEEWKSKVGLSAGF